ASGAGEAAATLQIPQRAAADAGKHGGDGERGDELQQGEARLAAPQERKSPSRRWRFAAGRASDRTRQAGPQTESSLLLHTPPARPTVAHPNKQRSKQRASGNRLI